MNITKTWWKTLTLEGLIGVDEDIPIQDVINKLQTIMDEGFTHVRGESKTMYYDPDEYPFVHEVVEDMIFSKK
jgi:hypothetical protein